MKILLTNDDGVHAPGIIALHKALSTIAETIVVAPDREQSAVGHALTLHHPLRVRKVSEFIFAVDGTPTDCVNLGIHSIMPFRPDIVISGINRGGNLADDVTYSGTVSAALEATLMGLPAMAVSLVTDTNGTNYAAAAAVAVTLSEFIVNRGLPDDTFLNVNVPDLPRDQLKAPLITTQGRRRYEGMIIDKIDPRGRTYYWIGNTSESSFIDQPGSDFFAIKRGHISITPLHTDFTNYSSLQALEQWQLS